MRWLVVSRALVALHALAPPRSPVATPAAFGAHDLGMPRVVPTTTGGGYALFYQYRPLEDAANPDLPPLSTGRVGRATSADGFRFAVARDGVGAAGSVVSASDDWFAFDAGHVGLGDVLWGGDAQFLYTFGGSTAPTALRDLGFDEDGDVTGMDLKIGVCVSQDGVNFGRIEGDEADGSLLGGDDASWERRGAPVAWPSVARAEDAFVLYYGTTCDATGVRAVGVATSPNGVRWTRARPAAPCVAGTAGAWDCGGVARTAVLLEAGAYLMLYEATDGAGVHRLGRATSANGLDWAKDETWVFAPGDDGDWDDGAVSSPSLLRLDDGTLRMYYAGKRTGGLTSFGVADSTDDGRTWVRV